MKTLIFTLTLLIAFTVNLTGQSRKFRIPSDSQGSDTALIRKHSYFQSQEMERDRVAHEKYPGSERFYARRPFLPGVPGRFNKKPDNTEKYYLIIKDPLLNKITN
jgi:hypothetical protein